MLRHAAPCCTCAPQWAPEVVRKEPQGQAADCWSLGVLLAYTAAGVHPFHKRWVGQSEARNPPAPAQCVVLPTAEHIVSAIEEAIDSHSTKPKAAFAMPLAYVDEEGLPDDVDRASPPHTTPQLQRTPSTPASPADLRGFTEGVSPTTSL